MRKLARPKGEIACSLVSRIMQDRSNLAKKEPSLSLT